MSCQRPAAPRTGISRRSVQLGGACAGAVVALAACEQSRPTGRASEGNLDLLVVGAGIAGLAAARASA